MKFSKVLTVLLLVLLTFSITGCGGSSATSDAEKPTILFADPQWDSIRFHNSVAQFIIENGYGYETDVVSGSSPIVLQGVINGDIDVLMETWTENYGESYFAARDKGDILELSVNFNDNAQGFYVPTYIIKGDPERGIEPMAPDLKSVKDLPKYWELFKDPEVPEKGRIYGAPSGYSMDEVMQEKVKNYGLDKTYNYFNPGSDTALAASLVQAIEKGKPWVGYYWEPTWIMGLYDMTLLADEPYSDEKWNNGYQCEFPSNTCTVAAHKDFDEKAPDVVEFLKNYQTGNTLINEALAYMQKNDVDTDEAAKWFLTEHEELWNQWVPAEAAEKVKAALK